MALSVPVGRTPTVIPSSRARGRFCVLAEEIMNPQITQITRINLMHVICGLARPADLRFAMLPNLLEALVLWSIRLVVVPAPPGRWLLRLVKHSRRRATPPLEDSIHELVQRRSPEACVRTLQPGSRSCHDSGPCEHRERSPCGLTFVTGPAPGG